MNSVIKLENTTAATAVGERGLLEAYADAFAGQRIVGKLLRFVKGDYIAGEDREGIAVGTVVTANMDALAVR